MFEICGLASSKKCKKEDDRKGHPPIDGFIVGIVSPAATSAGEVSGRGFRLKSYLQ
jgi:hypothetical protein